MNSISAYKSSISRMLATVVVAAGLAFGLTANAAQARDAGQTCYFGECLPRASTPAVAKAAPSDVSVVWNGANSAFQADLCPLQIDVLPRVFNERNRCLLRLNLR
jgi:hypothetical protein